MLEILQKYQIAGYLAVICNNCDNTLDLLNNYFKGTSNSSNGFLTHPKRALQ